MERVLVESLLLLGTAVSAILVFQRLHIPTSLAYFLVGVVFGPYTVGPVIDAQAIRGLAEFGIVFLLFTIGLNFALPQIHALRNEVIGLGTIQVVLTTALVTVIAGLAGAPLAAAFVIGAVFAQSSSTVISKQLAEQGEENSRHGRLGLAISVFQDVTAVPFVVAIPVLGATLDATALGTEMGLALAKGVLAFALVFLVGRRLLRPLFHLVASRGSADLFTLTVLFVTLLAAWTTNALGLSLAFGAFLAGMVLGETEFRHQVESTIRPFRDVLLGLFFVGIGMLVDPRVIADIWHVALAGALVLMLAKILIVAGAILWSGLDSPTAWRTGILLAVGGEFGFALLALALPVGAIDDELGQIALSSVLFSFIIAPFLIRYNDAIGRMLARRVSVGDRDLPLATAEAVGAMRDHVVICGFGRIGQGVAHFLEEEGIAYVALDLDVERVRAARLAGEPVFYGDSTEHDILDAVGIGTAKLVVVSHGDIAATRKVLPFIKGRRPDVPVMVRTRDELHVEELLAAGAAEVVPETLEASLMIASQALLLLNVPLSRIVRHIREQRATRYRVLRELVPGDLLAQAGDSAAERVRPVLVPPASPVVGKRLADIVLDGVVVTALVRGGERQLSPSHDTVLCAEDALVLFGYPDDLEKAERKLLG